ncbi:ATP-binding protein [Nonomuraea dietziae]|uniref:ATP-binding protein n=1 Tax=Nonomuraea dietziae TaxID=65515 RepID=UPI0033E99D08
MTFRPALPQETTSLVGRRAEVGAVRRALQRGRLVTLTGVAGVGKTRVAIRAARLTRRAFADGVVFVSLSGLTSAESLEHALAQAMGIHELVSHSGVRLLAGHLRPRRTLLVLDGCEHLPEEVSALAQALLAAAPGLHMLLTSRQVLRAPGEHTVEVRPMSVPCAGASLAEVAATESYALLVERMADPSFRLTEQNTALVSGLCRRLEGVPLAIELAAVRARVMPLEEILRTMGGQPGGSVMESAAGWSHDLCGPEERLLWRRLAVFAGPFDLAAAEAVCSGEGLAEEEIYPALAALVDRSVVITERDEGRVAYRMLGGVRQFALARMSAGELGELRRRHREHYLAMAVRLGCEQNSVSRLATWSTARGEWPNFRAAIESYAAAEGQVDSCARMLVGLWFLWLYAGMSREGRSYLERFLATSGIEGFPRLAALMTLTSIRVGQGDLEAARLSLAEADDLVAALGAAREPGEHPGSRRLEIVRGMYHFVMGELDAAEQGLRRALKAMTGSRGVAAVEGIVTLGLVHVAQLRFDEAVDVLRRARRLCAEQREDVIGAWADLILALALRGRGEYAEAMRLATSAVRAHARMRTNHATAFAVEVVGWLATDLDEHTRAAMLLSATGGLWKVEVSAFFGSRQLAREHSACEERLRAALGPHYVRAAAAGKAMSAAEVVACALTLCPGSSRQEEEHGLALLTPREIDVARLVADGLTNRLISQRLVIATRTVDTHVENILKKLGFAGRSQIAAWVIKERGRS